MKIFSTFATLALSFFLFSSSSLAQTVETIDPCKALHQEVTAAVEESAPLDHLLTDTQLPADSYLSQLYDGIRILSKSGEMFFKAADAHEEACKSALKKANNLNELAQIYDWYLAPAGRAYQFFKRARQAAVALNRQDDVDTFNKTMTEYDQAVMKLVGVCQSDLAQTEKAASCTALSVRLSEALR